MVNEYHRHKLPSIIRLYERGTRVVSVGTNDPLIIFIINYHPHHSYQMTQATWMTFCLCDFVLRNASYQKKWRKLCNARSYLVDIVLYNLSVCVILRMLLRVTKWNSSIQCSSMYIFKWFIVPLLLVVRNGIPQRTLLSLYINQQIKPCKYRLKFLKVWKEISNLVS